jgi:hypothetical protein
MVVRKRRRVVGLEVAFQDAQPVDLPRRKTGSPRTDITEISRALKKILPLTICTSNTWVEVDEGHIEEIKVESGCLYCTTRNKKGYLSAPGKQKRKLLNPQKEFPVPSVSY